jgi:hypothetical protein
VAGGGRGARQAGWAVGALHAAAAAAAHHTRKEPSALAGQPPPRHRPRAGAHLQQILPVGRLELLPRRRQERAARVVHQVELQARARRAVARGVEQPQALDRALEDAGTALRVDVGGRVARQARDDAHAVGGEERGQVLLAGLEQDGQVAAVDDCQGAGVRSQRAHARDEAPGGGEQEGRGARCE